MSVWGNWTDGDSPIVAGWYALVVCWDADEGISLAVERWRNGKWDAPVPVIAYQGPFSSQEQANRWAYENDPDDPPPQPAAHTQAQPPNPGK